MLLSITRMLRSIERWSDPLIQLLTFKLKKEKLHIARHYFSSLATKISPNNYFSQSAEFFLAPQEASPPRVREACLFKSEGRTI